MKNISLALNVVLVIAVAFLYYKQFSKPSAEVAESAPVKMNTEAKAASIVYVNSDSLLDNYTFYKNKKSEFEAKQKLVKSELQGESEKLQNEAADYQDRAATMTDSERQKKEGELMAKQQSLMKKKDDMLGKLDEDQQRWNDELYSKLGAYLRDFNKGKNFQYVLGYTRGGGILYATDSLDITKQVLDGMNKEFEAEKK